MVSVILSIIIFVLVIGSIVLDKINRTTAAVLGVVLLLLTHVMNYKEAIGFIDFDTIGILVGMMLFVGVIRHSGMFEYLSIKSAKLAGGDPWKITVLFIFITALCSAFLDNVTTVLLMGPMVISISKMLDINPVPILTGQIFASNIGGTATMIGDPPNIMIGSAADFGFADFLTHTGFTCLFILAILLVMMKVFFGRELVAGEDAVKKVMMLDENKAITNPKLLTQSVVMIVLVVVGFTIHDLIGVSTPVIALVAAAVMMLIGGQNIDEVVSDVEWPTLLFFMGLFVVVGGLEKTGVINAMAGGIMKVTKGHLVVTMIALLWGSAFASAILDNIPFVATIIPFIQEMGRNGVNTEPLWWAISLGACLGGNGTLVGASANLILSGISGKHGYPISFKSYMKTGLPVMIMSMIVSTVVLLIMYGGKI